MALVDSSVRPSGLAQAAEAGQDLPTPVPAWVGASAGHRTRLRPALARARSSRWLRYLLTSGLSTVISEIALVALYAAGITGAMTAAVLATMVGTIPSYLISRYWIWPEADRRGVGRQMTLYWLTTGASLVVSSLVTGAAAAHAPGGRALHVAVASIAYVGTYVILWVAKYVVYQKLVFVAPRQPAA
ncbi:MAG TPA: GtrA family protein [Candidatus Nanopelagicaceae bacterium]|nr:GtrA family protein [Candidatus Nanopelagicaceae bacterium]